MNIDGRELSHDEVAALYQERKQLFLSQRELEQQRAELAIRESAIAAVLARNYELEQSIAERDQRLAEKDQQIAERDQRLAEKDQQIAIQKQCIIELQQDAEKWRRMLFGPKRERFIVPDAQLLIPFMLDDTLVKAAVEVEINTIETERKPAKKKHPGRLALPSHWPVRKIIIEPQEDVSQMIRIGEEITDQIGYEPAKFFILRTIRPKYISLEDHNANQRMVIARMPTDQIDKCEATVDLLAQMMIDKHEYHMPIYRQLQRFAKLGLSIPASTADNWQTLVARLLRPLLPLLMFVIDWASYLQADETTIKVLDRSRKGKSHLGVMWVYRAPVERVVIFDYQRGHGQANCAVILSKPRKYLQTDGSAVYNVHRARADLLVLGCWAHVRRKFEQALSDDPERARIAMALIQKLYAIEADARERKLAPDLRKELRLAKSLPLLNTIGAWLKSQLEYTLPKSPIGKAVRYAIKFWDELQTYLLDGHLEIDNNRIENEIRPLAVGRKNYLFAGSHEGALNIAMYRTFFGTCHLNGIDPHAWLLYVLKNIRSTPTEEYRKLLPQNIDPALLS